MQSVYFHEEHSHHLWSGLPKANGSNCCGVWIYKLLSKLASGPVTLCIISSCVWSGCYLMEGELDIGAIQIFKQSGKRCWQIMHLWNNTLNWTHYGIKTTKLSIYWIYREKKNQWYMFFLLLGMLFIHLDCFGAICRELKTLFPFCITRQFKKFDK